MTKDAPAGINSHSLATTCPGRPAPGNVAMRRLESFLFRYTSYMRGSIGHTACARPAPASCNLVWRVLQFNGCIKRFKGRRGAIAWLGYRYPQGDDQFPIGPSLVGCTNQVGHLRNLLIRQESGTMHVPLAFADFALPLITPFLLLIFRLADT